MKLSVCDVKAPGIPRGRGAVDFTDEMHLGQYTKHYLSGYVEVGLVLHMVVHIVQQE